MLLSYADRYLDPLKRSACPLHYLFTQEILSACYLSGTILGTEDTVVNTKGKNSYPHQVYILIWGALGFPDSSVGKESACNVGDPDSIPGLARSTGEGNAYPL